MINLEIARYLYDRETARKGMLDQQLNFISLSFGLCGAVLGIFGYDINNVIDASNGHKYYYYIVLLCSGLVLLFFFSWYQGMRLRKWSAGIPADFEKTLVMNGALSDSDLLKFAAHFIAGYRINNEINNRRSYFVILCWISLIVIMILLIIIFLLTKVEISSVK